VERVAAEPLDGFFHAFAITMVVLRWGARS
jgi:hypothetical protein